MLILMQRKPSSFTSSSLFYLILSQNLSYNKLASAAIDQEGTMKACEAVKQKKRKRAMPGPSGGSSRCAPPKYRMIYTPLVG
jgi:hypothetical protein